MTRALEGGEVDDAVVARRRPVGERSSPPTPRPGWPATSTQASGRRHAGRRRPCRQVRRRRQRVLHRPHPLRRSPDRHVELLRRDLPPGALGVPHRHLRGSRRTDLRDPYGNGTAIFTNDGGTTRKFPERDRGRHDRHQCARAGHNRLLLLRRLEKTRCSATPTHKAPKACTSSPAESRHHAILKPSHGGINLGFRQNA
jgi:hypothetical protein